MQAIAVIGCGAVGGAVSGYLHRDGRARIVVAVIQQGMEQRAREVFGEDVEIVYETNRISQQFDVTVDCAGHPGLAQHGEAILAAGVDLVSVSSGALADAALYDRLASAARSGRSQLRVVSGAIGALDVLAAASVGELSRVTYRGRKPPNGWRGSAAERRLDLDALTAPAVHFKGMAREAALQYPKNANVAASVALAGTGFDSTTVELIADPNIERNIHEIVAEGDFGKFEFQIEGLPLPGNPRSSAITAMSVVNEILKPGAAILI